MPVASFVVTGTALRAAPGRPFPLPSQTFSSDLHAGPRLRMKDRQTRGALFAGSKGVPQSSSCPLGRSPDCPKWTPWYTVEETRPARSPTLSMQKRPVVVTGRFLCLSKANRAVLHPLRGTDHLFFRLWRYATCQGPEQKFWEGRGEHEGRGRTLFQKGLPLPLIKNLRRYLRFWARR